MDQLISIYQALIQRPKYAFSQIEQYKISAWQPFTLLIISMTLFEFLYFSIIDINWLHEYSVNLVAGGLSPAEQEQMRHILPQGDMLKYNSILVSNLALVFQITMLAAILNLFTKLDDSNTDGFTDWFAAVCWTKMPIILQLIIAATTLVLSGNNQILHPELFITSLNQIVQLEPSHAMYGFTTALDLFNLWCYVLVFYMLVVKTNLSSKTCLLIATFPIMAELVLSYFLTR